MSRARAAFQREPVAEEADTPCSSDDYVFVENLRLVRPYYFDFKCYVKKRWEGLTLVQLFSQEFPMLSEAYYTEAFRTGRLRVEGADELTLSTPLQTSMCVRHMIHRHEPPVLAGEVQVLGQTDEFVAVNKPACMPVHTVGQYRKNTVLGVLRAQCPELGLLYPTYRLDKPVSGLLLLAKTSAVAGKMRKLLEERSCSKAYLARVLGAFPSFPAPTAAAAVAPSELQQHAASATHAGNGNSGAFSSAVAAVGEQITVGSAAGESVGLSGMACSPGSTPDLGRIPVSEVLSGGEGAPGNNCHGKVVVRMEVLMKDVEAAKTATTLIVAAAEAAATTSTAATTAAATTLTKPATAAVATAATLGPANASPRPPVEPATAPARHATTGTSATPAALATAALAMPSTAADAAARERLLSLPGVSVVDDGWLCVDVPLTWDARTNHVSPVPKGCLCPPGAAQEPKDAVTHFRLVNTGPGGVTSVVEARPKTGRTHQIRVHLQYLGHAIANDTQYGGTYGPPLAFRLNRPPGGSSGNKHSDTGAQAGAAPKRARHDDAAAPLQQQQGEALLAECLEAGTSMPQAISGHHISAMDPLNERLGPERLPDHIQDLYTQECYRVDPEVEEAICPHCPCLVPKGYPIDLEPLWLHALSYKGPGWAFEAPPPAWAKQGFVPKPRVNGTG